jgi:predicted nucleic acid-binding protein
MTTAIILDTGGWLMALAGQSEYGPALERAETAWVPGLVLAEVDYHLRGRREEMWRVLQEIRHAPYQVEMPSDADLARAREIDRKFSQLDLGLVDASIVALAERLGEHRVLTTDADFAVVRCGPRWNQGLTLVVPPAMSAATRGRRRRRK